MTLHDPARRLVSMRWLALALSLTTATAAVAPSYRGVTVSCQTYGIEWQTPEMKAALDELHSLGVNAIAIHPYAQVQEDGHVTMRLRSGTGYITTPLQWAHGLGMSTMLIPHIAYWGTKFSWRGEINFATAAEWDRFFTDYESWIVQMAKLAQDEHCELFCVGLEFAYAEKFPERWRQIIAAVRQVYTGKLTYGANWDNYQDVTFWDALDYIGVLAYFPLTKAPDPTVADITAAWEKRCVELEAFSKRYGRQFIFTELGYNESARAAAEPWGFKTGGANAAEIQQRCLDVALSLPEKHSFLAGMFLWKWFPEVPSHEEENYRLQTPAIKALISRHWQAAK